MSTRVFVGLGSNLGAPVLQVRRALGWLAAHPHIRLQRASRLVSTVAIGPVQPDYVNAVVELKTRLSPVRLLRVLQSFEMAAGRRRVVRWGARTLDCDLLLYGDQTLDRPDLILPHPRMHERAFVLGPLSQLAPDLVHPRLDRTVGELLLEVRGDLAATSGQDN